MHLKKNDTVKVLSGREKGRTGRVIRILAEKQRAEVEGLMTVKRHLKRGRSQQSPEGGIVEKAGTIHISNLMVMCPKCNEPTRVGHKTLDDGKKIRACKRCGGNLDDKKA